MKKNIFTEKFKERALVTALVFTVIALLITLVTLFSYGVYGIVIGLMEDCVWKVVISSGTTLFSAVPFVTIMSTVWNDLV